MPGYTKLFSSIIASTIWREPDHVRIVWVTMLAMANQHGEVEASVPGLADFSRVTVEQCRDALRVLSSPDPESRTPDHEGRRIEACEGGFRLLNHAKYRTKLNQDDRREYLRKKQASYRARRQSVTAPSTGIDTRYQMSTVLTQAEAKAEASTTPNPLQGAVVTDDTTGRKAGAFLEAYPEVYARCRNGASILMREARDFPTAIELVSTWPDPGHLESMLRLFLLKKDWSSKNEPGTVRQFAHMAPQCDALLRAERRR